MFRPAKFIATVALAGLMVSGCAVFHHSLAQDKNLGTLATDKLKFDCAVNLSVPDALKILAAKNLTVPDEPLGDCYASSNLNNSGKDELLVQLTGSFYSGTGGNQFYIFSRDQGSWQLINDGQQSVYLDGVSVGATATNGYNDLTIYNSQSRPTTRITYDGTLYRTTKLVR